MMSGGGASKLKVGKKTQGQSALILWHFSLSGTLF